MTSFAEKYGKKPTFTSKSLEDVAGTESKKAIDPASMQSSAIGATKPMDLQKRALAELIYLVKGIDAGRNAWYYVLVERNKVQLFLKALNDDIIHLEHYGKILYSAYGDEPPAEITAKLKEEYGIK